MADERAKRGLLLAASWPPIFLAAMESTVVATAMPHRGREPRRDPHLLLGLLRLPADLDGVDAALGPPRPTPRPPAAYLVGLVSSCVGSALAGFSQTMEQLIAFRTVQGLGAGSLITIGMTIIGELLRHRAPREDAGLLLERLGRRLAGRAAGRRAADRPGVVALGLLHQPAVRAPGAGRHRRGLRRRERRRAARDRRARDGALRGRGVRVAGGRWSRRAGSESLATWLDVPPARAVGVLLVVFVPVERRASEPVVPLRLFGNPMVRRRRSPAFSPAWPCSAPSRSCRSTCRP